jgi:hypothetical protein
MLLINHADLIKSLFLKLLIEISLIDLNQNPDMARMLWYTHRIGYSFLNELNSQLTDDYLDFITGRISLANNQLALDNLVNAERGWRSFDSFGNKSVNNAFLKTTIVESYISGATEFDSGSTALTTMSNFEGNSSSDE